MLNFVAVPLGKDGHKRLEDNETQRFPGCGRRPWIGECVFVYINHLAHLKVVGVGGVKVSIVAFQAIDPGSIPGQRTFFFFFFFFFSFRYFHSLHVLDSIMKSEPMETFED